MTARRRLLTPALVLELKAEAKQMKTRDGIKQTAALATIAKREGYRSWEELIGLAGGADAVREAKLDAPPDEAKVKSNERKAERRMRYGDGT